MYALTANGQWVADKLEKAVVASAGGARQATSTTTASPILNRSSYASCSERDGGGGGGTAASRHSGHSPLAPTRANGAAKPGVRLLIDNREKRGTTRNSQVLVCGAGVWLGECWGDGKKRGRVVDRTCFVVVLNRAVVVAAVCAPNVCYFSFTVVKLRCRQ